MQNLQTLTLGVSNSSISPGNSLCILRKPGQSIRVRCSFLHDGPKLSKESGISKGTVIGGNSESIDFSSFGFETSSNLNYPNCTSSSSVRRLPINSSIEELVIDSLILERRNDSLHLMDLEQALDALDAYSKESFTRSSKFELIKRNKSFELYCVQEEINFESGEKFCLNNLSLNYTFPGIRKMNSKFIEPFPTSTLRLDLTSKSYLESIGLENFTIFKYLGNIFD